ncbi:uncharacterized protein LOC111362702 isoform X2 [Spodoptera litura]|uniref:Uncharacterized protein LOC111362702 isoform X2 n=1 Tax=Spodoptera litura TaxID=69820 RepID=A0A9J7EUF1_SPOLT|nr:uncharacterized protein LOC111362702 isoform X2 [Spodoptera litura]
MRVLASQCSSSRRRRNMAAALSSSVCVLLVVLPLPPPPVEAAVPGTFFWKPSTDLDLTRRQINPAKREPYIYKPTEWNFGYHKQMAIAIDGYRLSTTLMAIYVYVDFMNRAYPALHPCYADYWTNAYRWLIRYLSLIPDWIHGRSDNYVATHRVWRKRFFFMDWWMPKWARKFFLCVPPESWAWEQFTWRRWRRYVEPQFGKYYIYPSKVFTDFQSMQKGSTVENLDMSSASLQ